MFKNVSRTLTSIVILYQVVIGKNSECDFKPHTKRILKRVCFPDDDDSRH